MAHPVRRYYTVVGLPVRTPRFRSEPARRQPPGAVPESFVYYGEEFMYKHIVIAIDGSKTSLHALKQACALVQGTGAKLTLVHVANPAEYVATIAPEFLQYENYETAATEQGNAILDAAEKQARSVLGENAQIGRHLLVISKNVRDMAKSLVDYAAEQHSDLLVLGTHGRTGLMHLLMGSFAETVMRETRLPLLIIRREG